MICLPISTLLNVTVEDTHTKLNDAFSFSLLAKKLFANSSKTFTLFQFVISFSQPIFMLNSIPDYAEGYYVYAFIGALLTGLILTNNSPSNKQYFINTLLLVVSLTILVFYQSDWIYYCVLMLQTFILFPQTLFVM